MTDWHSGNRPKEKKNSSDSIQFFFYLCGRNFRKMFDKIRINLKIKKSKNLKIEKLKWCQRKKSFKVRWIL